MTRARLMKRKYEGHEEVGLRSVHIQHTCLNLCLAINIKLEQRIFGVLLSAVLQSACTSKVCSCKLDLTQAISLVVTLKEHNTSR